MTALVGAACTAVVAVNPVGAVRGAVAVGGGFIGFSGLYVGGMEVLIGGGLVALVLGLLFKGAYVRYMREVGGDAE